MAYDDPNARITREIALGIQTSASSATINKVLQFQAATLKNVHAVVTTAGTDTGAGFDVYVGTASVGSVTCGTSTAGTVFHAGDLEAAVPANGVIELKGKADSDTLKFAATLEVDVLWNAVETP